MTDDDAMGMRMTPRNRVWLVPLLGLLSLGATGRDVPLVEAVKAKDVATVRALLQQPLDVKVAELDGTTALHWPLTAMISISWISCCAPVRTFRRRTDMA